MTTKTPLHMMKSFPLSDLVSDCCGIVNESGSVSKIVFGSFNSGRRFMSMVNQVEPAHLGCSIEYHKSYAIARVELAPGQTAMPEPDKNALFFSDDIAGETEMDGFMKAMMASVIDHLEMAAWATAQDDHPTVNSGDLPYPVGGVIRCSVGGGLLVLDHNGHVVNLPALAKGENG